MACIRPDGTLEPAARSVLKVLDSPQTVEEIARQLRMPVYRVRMSLRELSEAGLVIGEAEHYRATDAGRIRLEQDP